MFTADGVLTIYSLGDSIFLSNVLNGISMITTGGDSSTDRGSFLYITAIGAMFGFILTALRGLQTGKAFDLNSLMLCIIAWYFFFGWNVSVSIRDVFHNEDRLVAHVPGGVALTGSAISSLGWGLTSIYEQAFLPVTAEGGISKGLAKGAPFADTAKTLNALTTLGANPALITALDKGSPKGTANRISMRENIINYINECTMKAVNLGYKNLSDVFHMTVVPEGSSSGANSSGGGPVDETSALSFNNGGNIYMTSYNGDTVNCSTALNRMNTDLDSALKSTSVKAIIAANTVDPTQKQTSGVSTFSLSRSSSDDSAYALRKIDDVMGILGKDADTAQNMIKASIYYHIFPLGAASNALSAGDRATATMLEQARMQRNTQWSGEGTMFQQTMIPIMTFIEGFTYAVTPFMGLFLLLGMFGVSLSIKYFMLVAWVQSWMPCLAIANNYIDSSLQRAISDFGMYTANNATQGRLDSFEGVMRVMDIAQNHLATAGMFIGAIPIITLFIFSGSIYALSSLTSRMNGAEFINERIPTPDMLSPASVMSGISQMNTQFGVTNQQNASWGSISLSTGAGVNVAESQNLMHQAQLGMSDVSNKAYSILNSTGQGYSASSVWDNSTSSNRSEGLAITNSLAQSFKEAFGNDISDQKAQQLAHQTISEGGVDGAKMAAVAGEAMVEKWFGGGVAKAVGKIAQKAGGDSFATKLAQAVSVKGSVSSSSNDNQSVSLSSLTSSMQGVDQSYVESGKLSADYTKAVSASLNNTDSITANHGENASFIQQYGEQASKLDSAVHSYQEARSKSQSSSLQQSVNVEDFVRAARAGNNEITKTVDKLYNNLSEGEKQSIENQAQANYNSHKIGDIEDARLAAKATYLASDQAKDNAKNRVELGKAYFGGGTATSSQHFENGPSKDGLNQDVDKQVNNHLEHTQATVNAESSRVNDDVNNKVTKESLEKLYGENAGNVKVDHNGTVVSVSNDGRKAFAQSIKTTQEDVNKDLDNYNVDASKRSNMSLKGHNDGVLKGAFDKKNLNGVQTYTGQDGKTYLDKDAFDKKVDSVVDKASSPITQGLSFKDPKSGATVETQQSKDTDALVKAITKSHAYGVLNQGSKPDNLAPNTASEGVKKAYQEEKVAVQNYLKSHPGMTEEDVSKIKSGVVDYLRTGHTASTNGISLRDTLHKADLVAWKNQNM